MVMEWFYSETDVSLAGDTGECGEKIVEEVDPEIAGASECADLAFHDQKDEKGTLINGEYLKGYISNRFRNSGFTLPKVKRRGFAYIQRGRANDNLDFWRKCREWRVDGRIVLPYSKRRQEFDINKYRGRRPHSGNSFPIYTAADLASASYFNYYVRSIVSQECVRTHTPICLSIKTYADGFDRNNPPSAYWQKQFKKTGCDKFLKLSCSIEPKGIWNTPGATCRQRRGQSHDCSIRSNIEDLCVGIKGYETPGCKGFRSTKEELYKKGGRGYSCSDKGLSSKENLRSRGYPEKDPSFDGPIFSGGRNRFCSFLTLDHPKALALIQEEEDYKQYLRDEKNKSENDYDSDEGGYRALSGKPLSITLVAEGDILVSGNANIQNFKNDNHPEEIQNLLFVAAGDIDLDGNVPEPIDGIVTAGEQVSLTANAELSGYVIASDVYEESSVVTESKILENFTVTYNDLKNPFLNDQTKILSWKQ